jgi:flagellar hook protein FlgE
MASQGDDEMDELENMDKTACEEKLEKLQEQRERMREDTERLQEKLKALNNELAARKEEKKKIYANLQQANKTTQEKSKSTKGAKNEDRLAMLTSGDHGTRDWVVDKVKKQVDDDLGAELADKKHTTSDNGIHVFDEMDLMVRKSEKDQAKEPKVDTVLVTFVQPNVETKFHLSFRIDESTTAKKLQEDACEYWGQSHLEFILQNITGSKVHDEVYLQNCFLDNEEHHLILAKKQPRSTSVSEEEYAAIRQKVGVGVKKKKAEKEENLIGSSRPEEKFNADLRKVPGFWDFMTQHDKGVTTHVDRIKCRSILLYCALAIATLISIFGMRAPGTSYIVRAGIVHSMTRTHYDPVTTQLGIKYHDVDSISKIYDWLSSVGSSQLFNGTSQLRTDNYLPGWLHLRMQRVADPSHAACEDMSWIPDSVACYYAIYDESTAGTQELPLLRDYWEGVSDGTNVSLAGVDGRSANDLPYRYTASPDGISYPAMYESFDTSGYRGATTCSQDMTG